MNHDDILRIKASWKKLQPRKAQLAEAFYARLFEFEPWLEKPFGEDRRLGGRGWLAFIDAAVANLDDPAQRREQAHRQIPRACEWGLREDDIYMIGLALFSALENELAGAFCSSVRHAWGMLYGELAEELLGSLRAVA